MQKPSKVYFDKNGMVVLRTSECEGNVISTTKEQDLKHLNLQNINDIDYIEIDFGLFNKTFNNAKSYYVNVETKQLIVEYYKDGETGDNIEDSQPTELELLQNENENLVDQIINLKAENLLLKMEG